ncbi:cellulose synthase operon protein C [Komagataeibacter oboediens]|nr:cellulose synthase operon protein C [Komagataeibacter oboediens]
MSGRIGTGLHGLQEILPRQRRLLTCLRHQSQPAQRVGVVGVDLHRAVELARRRVQHVPREQRIALLAVIRRVNAGLRLLRLLQADGELRVIGVLRQPFIIERDALPRDRLPQQRVAPGGDRIAADLGRYVGARQRAQPVQPLGARGDAIGQDPVQAQPRVDVARVARDPGRKLGARFLVSQDGRPQHAVIFQRQVGRRVAVLEQGLVFEHRGHHPARCRQRARFRQRSGVHRTRLDLRLQLGHQPRRRALALQALERARGLRCAAFGHLQPPLQEQGLVIIGFDGQRALDRLVRLAQVMLAQPVIPLVKQQFEHGRRMRQMRRIRHRGGRHGGRLPGRRDRGGGRTRHRHVAVLRAGHPARHDQAGHHGAGQPQAALAPAHRVTQQHPARGATPPRRPVARGGPARSCHVILNGHGTHGRYRPGPPPAPGRPPPAGPRRGCARRRGHGPRNRGRCVRQGRS